MFKINYYSLFFLAVLFFNNSNVLYSSFSQSDGHKSGLSFSLPSSAHNAHPRTNTLGFVSHMPTHHINFDSLPDDLLPTNSSNMQQEATGHLVLSGPNLVNVNNNTTLPLIPYEWYFNIATNTLFSVNNNEVVSISYNATATLTNSVFAPILHRENASSTITISSSNANTNNNTTRSVMLHTQQVARMNEDKDCAQAENNNKQKGTKIYTCPTCHKNLATQDSLNYHVKTHNPNRPRPYHCTICDKSFAEKRILKNHLKRHSKEKLFLCDFCSKSFITNFEKIRHMRTHASEKPFKCDFCQKGLSSKVTLKDHLNIHKGKKPYQCGQCTKAYATQSGLKNHIKKHNRPQPYACRYCGANFLYKSAYEKHIRYEEEEEENRKCHHCKKAFSNKFCLERHNKKKHQEHK